MADGPDRAEEYFEEHVHDYSPRRLETLVAWVEELAGEDDRLLDVGCGSGVVLEAISRVGLSRLSGCDVAGAALETAQQRVEFQAFRGSILDGDLVHRLRRRFELVTMVAVLHHLVGGTRRRSDDRVLVALANSLQLVAPGGRLLVVEPTFAPRWAAWALFWLKRLVTTFTGGRLELGRWNNVGAPLVSFLTPAALDERIGRAGGTVLRAEDRPWPLRRLPRLLGFRGHWTSTRVVAPRYVGANARGPTYPGGGP
jgi:SAM-dependent methyltransferase